MVYKLMINLCFLTVGYYLGREVGRTEAVRNRLRQARRTGKTINLRDAIIVDMESSDTNGGSGSVKH